MSCSCGCSCSSGCNSCGCSQAVSADNESLPSALDNFILHFFGTITKTVVNDEVVWTLPCDLASDEPIPGHPREENEGLACYFKRVLSEDIVGFDGKNAFGFSTEDFIQPAVNGTVEIAVDVVYPFRVGQYIWGSTGGFYRITVVNDGPTPSIVARNLYGPDNGNTSPGTTITAGILIATAGAPGQPGADGEDGAAGHTGPTGYTGPRGATGYTGPAGDAGPPGSEAARVWNFLGPGTHHWLCPTGVTAVRVQIYGAGGGGGGGASAGNGSGNGFGGGGGEYAERQVTVVPATTYLITVGAGGAGGTGGDSSATGSNGGDSDFSSDVTTYLVAKGGGGGGAAVSGIPGIGGTGGAGTATVRRAGFDAIAEEGGHAGRLGTGGIGGVAGGAPGGGGGAGIGDGGGPMTGAPGLAGAVGGLVLSVVE